MFIALLGRQPEISVAELSAVYGDKAVRQISPEAALVDSRSFTIADLGGTTKYGEVVAELPSHPKDQAALQSASKYILDHYYKKWRHNEHKTTLGISAYGLKVSASDVQKIGLQLKRFLKKDGASLRLVPTTALALSTAQTLHNHLFSNERKVELIIAKTNDRRIVIAECRGVQNIDAYTKRDHGRPKRDAFVGMLPPKLAQIMINLAVGLLSRPHSLPSPPSSSTPLPSYASLCRSLPSGPVSSPHEAGASWGPRTRSAPTSRKLEVGAAPPRATRAGVVVDGAAEPSERPSPTEGSAFPAERTQESGNWRVRVPEGGDGSEEERAFNLATLLDPFCGTGVVLQEAALMGFSVYGTDLSEKMIDYSEKNLQWLQESHNTQVTSRLEVADAMKHNWSQPISAVVCETYLGQPFSAPPSPAKLKEVVGNCNHIISTFLKNIHPQLTPGTPLCIAVPAWRDKTGRLTHLPLINTLANLGYTLHRTPLVYARENQVVAREILVLRVKP